MSEAEKFFREHAGHWFNPNEETEEEGRARCARELAEAEERMKSGPYFVSVEPDPEDWDGDEPYDGPLWLVVLWTAEDRRDPAPMGSVGMVACEDGDDYLRVVAAELAAEHIPVKVAA